MVVPAVPRRGDTIDRHQGIQRTDVDEVWHHAGHIRIVVAVVASEICVGQANRSERISRFAVQPRHHRRAILIAGRQTYPAHDQPVNSPGRVGADSSRTAGTGDAVGIADCFLAHPLAGTQDLERTEIPVLMADFARFAKEQGNRRSGGRPAVFDVQIAGPAGVIIKRQGAIGLCLAAIIHCRYVPGRRAADRGQPLTDIARHRRSRIHLSHRAHEINVKTVVGRRETVRLLVVVEGE